MKTSLVVIFALIVVALANLLPVFTGGMERVVLAGAFGLLAVVGAYTGMDLSAIAEGSRKLPKGEYVATNKNKYIFMILALLIITVECIIITMWKGVNLEDSIAMYLFSSLSIAGIYTAGMKNNKKATMEGV
jgi:LytS/YehU family sensor histidine kinase